MWPCLTPLILIGQLLTVQPNHYHTSDPNGPVFKAMTCEQGLGLQAKAAPTVGLYGGGVQYGIPLYESFHWSSTILGGLGFSHSTRTYPELPLETQFETSVSVLLGYDNWRGGIEWWHLSNAGLQQPNIGLDTIIIQIGVVAW